MMSNIEYNGKKDLGAQTPKSFFKNVVLLNLVEMKLK